MAHVLSVGETASAPRTSLHTFGNEGDAPCAVTVPMTPRNAGWEAAGD